MNAQIVDLNGEQITLEGVRTVSFVNNDSFGDGEKVARIREDGGDVLVLNTNGFAAALFTRDN